MRNRIFNKFKPQGYKNCDKVKWKIQYTQKKDASFFQNGD